MKVVKIAAAAVCGAAYLVACLAGLVALRFRRVR